MVVVVLGLVLILTTRQTPPAPTTPVWYVQYMLQITLKV